MSRGYGAMVSPEPRSMPYDWNITTKEFVLRTLTNLDGKEFTPAVEVLTVYQMPDTTQGPYKDGIYFWHDFSRDGPSLVPHWRDEINYLQKYPFLWDRFIRVIRDPSIKKVFLISNTQSNLDQYADDRQDYERKFGIDAQYLDELKQKLDLAGALNYEFLVLFREVEEFLNVLEKSDLDYVDPRFIGSHWTLNNTIANSLIQRAEPVLRSATIAGLYRSGEQVLEVRTAPRDTLIVFDGNKQVWAVAKAYADGYFFSFAREGTAETEILTAVEGDGAIHFSNDYVWKKI